MTSRLAAALLALCLGLHAAPAAAADDIQTGWAAWFNTTAIDDRTSLVSDVQVRSSDEWASVRTLLARAALSRTWRPGVTLAAGYAYVGTLNPGAPDLTEHRLWQQLVLQRSLGSRPLTHRFRLEQRFIERAGGGDVYSDRFRYFARLMIPLQAGEGAFSRGNYVALQNEVFLTLSGRDDLTGKLFDQNRAYVAFGRRMSAGLDLEIGYLNQFIAGRNRDTMNHALQVALYTRW